MVAVRTDLKSDKVPELDTNCEIIWATVKLQGRKTLYVCSYYRPDSSDEDSLNEFSKSLDRASMINNAEILIAGDLNFPGWDWPMLTLKTDCPYVEQHRKLLKLIQDHGMEQMVKEPTREDNILDLVISNHPHNIPRIEVAPGLSDHRIVFFEYTATPPRIRQPPRLIPLYEKADWIGIKTEMEKLHQTLKTGGKVTTEEIWQAFKDTLQEAIRRFIPHKKARMKASKPWVTIELRRKINRRNRLYKRMKKSGAEDQKEECRRLRREIQREFRRAYWLYINDTLTEDEEDGFPSLKRFWTYIKNQRTAKIGVSPLKTNGRLITEPKAQAELLNQQFQSVFSEGKTYTKEEFMTKCKMDVDGDLTTLSSIEITVEGVTKLLGELNPHKAAGPDGISPRILKELANEVAPILTMIFQSSLETGVVPLDWRKANVTPVYKKGAHYDPANYRPVSLTSVSCKTMEHIIVRALMSHLDENNILCKQQHGFRRGRSCETQLIEFVEALNRHMAEGRESEAIILDFAKAFDKVNHSLLTHKLHCYGIQGGVNQWISGFLSNRQQAVVVNGTKSDSVDVRSGVPQGSVLGPCLFLVYINDLPDRLTSQTRLFADDTAIHRPVANIQDQGDLQRDLEKLEEWEASWEMKFHPDKCSTLRFSRKHFRLEKTVYKLHGHSLAIEEATKYLGVILQHDLSWNTHIETICSKANKTLGFLRRNLRIGSQRLKETAYKTFVRPILEYACSVWDPYTQENIDRLEDVQRRAARFVCNNYHRTASVTDMLNHLNWSSLEHRRMTSRLSMLFRIRKNMVQLDSETIRGNLIPKRARGRRGQHNQQYMEKNIHTQDYRLGSFFPRTTRDWNKLPQGTVDAETLGTFVSRVQRAM